MRQSFPPVFPCFTKNAPETEDTTWEIVQVVENVVSVPVLLVVAVSVDWL